MFRFAGLTHPPDPPLGLLVRRPLEELRRKRASLSGTLPTRTMGLFGPQQPRVTAIDGEKKGLLLKDPSHERIVSWCSRSRRGDRRHQVNFFAADVEQRTLAGRDTQQATVTVAEGRSLGGEEIGHGLAERPPPSVTATATRGVGSLSLRRAPRAGSSPSGSTRTNLVPYASNRQLPGLSEGQMMARRIIPRPSM